MIEKRFGRERNEHKCRRTGIPIFEVDVSRVPRDIVEVLDTVQCVVATAAPRRSRDCHLSVVPRDLNLRGCSEATGRRTALQNVRL